MLFKSLSVTKLGDINNGKEDEKKITKLPFINEFFSKRKTKKRHHVIRTWVAIYFSSVHDLWDTTLTNCLIFSKFSDIYLHFGF